MGFRVAMLPEPGTGLLMMRGLLGELRRLVQDGARREDVRHRGPAERPAGEAEGDLGVCAEVTSSAERCSGEPERSDDQQHAARRLARRARDRVRVEPRPAPRRCARRSPSSASVLKSTTVQRGRPRLSRNARSTTPSTSVPSLAAQQHRRLAAQRRAPRPRRAQQRMRERAPPRRRPPRRPRRPVAPTRRPWCARVARERVARPRRDRPPRARACTSVPKRVPCGRAPRVGRDLARRATVAARAALAARRAPSPSRRASDGVAPRASARARAACQLRVRALALRRDARRSSSASRMRCWRRPTSLLDVELERVRIPPHDAVRAGARAQCRPGRTDARGARRACARPHERPLSSPNGGQPGAGSRRAARSRRGG